MQHGIRGYFAGFEEEARRRATLIGEDYQRTVEALIAQEKSGDVAVKVPLLDCESPIELSLLGLMSVGLLIGLGQFTLGYRGHGGSPARRLVSARRVSG
jgi:hypothetical protein